jgi:hypothetical protein
LFAGDLKPHIRRDDILRVYRRYSVSFTVDPAELYLADVTDDGEVVSSVECEEAVEDVDECGWRCRPRGVGTFDH